MFFSFLEIADFSRAKRKATRFHNFFIFSSPQFGPFCVSIILFCFVIDVLHYLHNQSYRGGLTVVVTFAFLCWCVFEWFGRLVSESYGFTTAIRRGLRIGMLLFITSEVMFFFAFFWAFFHVALSPPIEFGCVWPPQIIKPLVGDPFHIPLINTMLLLVSGMYITYSHHFIEHGLFKNGVHNADKRLVGRLFFSRALLEERFSNLEGATFLNYICQRYRLSKYQAHTLFQTFNRVWRRYVDTNLFLNVNLHLATTSTTRRWLQTHTVWLLLLLFRTNLNNSNGTTQSGAGARNYSALAELLLIWGLARLRYVATTIAGERGAGARFFYLFRANWRWARLPIIMTLVCAVLFTLLQAFEYYTSDIYISDGVYGSTFYLLTGFHGLHVLIGTIFISVCFSLLHTLKKRKYFYSDGHIVSFECSIWYWHFVDVVWLFLYLFVYIWGSVERRFDFAQISSSVLSAINMADFSYDKQLFFQDSASTNMDIIITLHNYIMFYIVLIFILVFWLFINLILQNRLENKVGYFFEFENELFNSQNFVTEFDKIK